MSARAWLFGTLLSVQLAGAGVATAAPWASSGAGSVMPGLDVGRTIMSGGLLGLAPRWVGLVVFAPIVATAVAVLGVAGAPRLWSLLSVLFAAIGPVVLLRLSMLDRLGAGGAGVIAVFGCAAVLLATDSPRLIRWHRRDPSETGHATIEPPDNRLAEGMHGDEHPTG